jgi:tRNA 2-thiouridine synthesizing protein D
MDKITIIVNESPGTMRAWNGLRLAGGMLGVDMEVTVFLLDNGVYITKKNQQLPDGLKEFNLEQKVSELIGLGVKVYVCTTCATSKGLTPEDTVEGVEFSNLTQLCKSVKESKQTLVF